MTNVYIGRNNTAEISLLEDGAAIASNVATRAVLSIPARAFEGGVSVEADTSTSGLSFNVSKTVLTLDIGDFDLIPGEYLCQLTVYDAVNTDGLAWSRILITVEDWV